MMQGDTALLYAMEAGVSLEEGLITGHNEPFYQHLRFFLQISSLSDAITSALSITDIGKHFKTKLVKQISYPLLLFCLAFLTLYVFSAMILPQLMQGFDMSSDVFLTVALSFLQLFANLLLWIILLCLGLGFTAYKVSSVKLFLLKHLRFLKIPQQYCSYLFASYYIQFIRHGITTKNAIAFLAQREDTSILTVCAKQMKLQLEAGKTIEESFREIAWIDEVFIKNWLIGIHTQNMEQVLQQYQSYQMDRWKHYLKRLGQAIQVFSYGFVACMVVLVYQIMLVPLQLLETM